MAFRADTVAILERFPGPVTLYQSRNKWLLVLALAVALMLGVSLVIGNGDAIGWSALLFLAAVALFAYISLLLPSLGALTLDRDGFELVGLFRRFRIRWRDASGFVAAYMPRTQQRYVLFDDAAPDMRLLAKLSTAVAGHSSALTGMYEVPADELAWLMASWRERALAGK